MQGLRGEKCVRGDGGLEGVSEVRGLKDVPVVSGCVARGLSFQKQTCTTKHKYTAAPTYTTMHSCTSMQTCSIGTNMVFYERMTLYDVGLRP